SVNQNLQQGKQHILKYEDNKLSDNIQVYYYKIRVYGQNGNKEESKVVALKPKSSSLHGIKLTPNPASSALKLQYHSERRETARINVLDHSGRLVQTESMVINTGANNLEIRHIEQLPNGMYIIVFILENQTFREKILIKH
ncbi:MAG: T9SS type A sorting domain-containing protein, partial [Chitinophagaceae bacterium]